MPSKWIFFFIILGVYYFVVSGSFYTLTTQNVQTLGTTGTGSVTLILQGIHRQYILEGVVGGMFYFIGFLGFYFAYQSTRHVYRPRYAQMMLAIGWALIFLSFLVCQYLIAYKLGLLET
ncbi:MAG: hypothetical protein ACFFCO_01460 [Promethearchaeota archaeon]